VLPQIPGIPWWGAIALAVTLTAVGFAYDAGAGTKALGSAFGVCYVTGCVLAVLAVRQSGLFSAVIQPPLILFVAVPTAYFAFHGSEIKGIKDLLINCGYPLIERFPLMFLTAATVLLIGMARWYLAMTAHRHEPTEEDATEEPAASASGGAVAAALAKVASKLSSRSTAEDGLSRRSRRHSIERPTRAAPLDDDDAPRPRRPRPAATSRSRHARPPETEIIDAVQARPRRPRPAGSPVDPSADPRRRRPRSDETRERRNPPPADRRAAPERGERPIRAQRSDRPTRAERPERPIRRERAERYERPDPYDRPERRHRMPDYPAYEPYEPPASNAAGAGSATHHPVSRVRYRGGDDEDSRVEHRSRPRRSRNATPEAWEYDI
jgi:hypothetical protein